jgi:hypothetical protein
VIAIDGVTTRIVRGCGFPNSLDLLRNVLPDLPELPVKICDPRGLLISRGLNLSDLLISL